ncbi:MAG TPA: polysaccharide deacetylase [Candidatus Acidoferrum sp.]|jgi:peptidoglycan/xylan/chitin deacetylase (PgdA/CDA1 family)|nr:polysaccharide deacetylase [Candidatus Acidoferrum sp.]
MSLHFRLWGLAFALSLSIAIPAAAQEQQQAPGFPAIPIDANEEQVSQAVALVRAGQKLTPEAWPNKARVAVCLTFDVDNELLWRRAPLPVPLSQGEYGATTGLPRILDLLDRQKVPASFYIPAMSAALHPQMIQDIVGRNRHEIGVHGWMHENLPSIGDAAKEEQLLTQSIDYLTTAVGKRPVGFRAPSWAFSQHTLDQIRKAGFLYDSSFMAMDEPYELIANGQKTGMIELPINWIADDYPYYEPQASGSLPDPDLVYQIYKAEFDAAYQERTLFILTMHPHITGHRSRIAQLEKLVTYMKSKPGVWFATLEQVADYVKKTNASK